MKKTYTAIAIFSFLFAIGYSAIAQTKPIVKDDPINRAVYETERLVNPLTGEIPENIRVRELEFARRLPSKLKSANANVWTHRGPFNVGGRTRALALDINNENTILAGGASGGMWRSADGGTSWTKVTSVDALHSVTAIAQDIRPGYTDTWYYGTGELSGNSASKTGAKYRGDGVFKSTDNGLSWTQLSATVSNTPEIFTSDFQYCWNIKVSPTNGNVYVATYGAVYRSTDGGANWSAIFNSFNSNYGSYETDVAVSSTGTLYIAMSSDGDITGFYKSTDNGDNWTNITPTGFPTIYERTVIDIAASNENIVYFLSYTPGTNDTEHSLWRYDDSNASWSDYSANIPNLGNLTGTFDSQGGYDLLVKIKPDDENFVIIGGTDLWRDNKGFSGDASSVTLKIGGYKPTNTTYYSYTNQHPDQHSLVFFPSDAKKVISGHDGGLSLTVDVTKSTEDTNSETVVWSSLNVGYLTTQAYTVALDMENVGDVNIISGFQDNGSWTTDDSNGTVDWLNIGGGDGAYCAIGDNGNSHYSSSQNGTVYRDWYDNVAKEWKWTEVDPEGATGQAFINPFILDPNNTNMMYYLGGDVIWRNTDLTAIPEYSSDPATVNWSKMTNTTVTGTVISALDVSMNNPANVLYFGTSNGSVFRVEGADTGDPVKSEITCTGFPSANVGCVKVNPNNSSEVMISFTNYEVVSVWHTTDAGLNWESVSGNLEENPDGSGSGPSVGWVEMLEKDNGDKFWFAGTSTGLYYTTLLNGTNTVWTQESPTMIGNVVVDMVKSRVDGTVVIGTHGNGIYSTTIDMSTSIKREAVDNVKAKIYPNPSNGNFTIEVKGNAPADYRVIIYNINGQAVYYSNRESVTHLKESVNLQSQAKGVYNVEVLKNRETKTYKIVLK